MMDTTIDRTEIQPEERRGVLRAARDLGRALLETYRRGGRMIRLAPAILAIAVVPEFVQHIAEIHLGMFNSLAAFHAHANDPLRWGFGYAKVAGFVIAILATARFWAVGSVRRALLPGPMTLAKVAAAIVIGFALAWPFDWLGRQGFAAPVSVLLSVVSGIIQAGVMIYLIGALLEDAAITPRRAFTTLLPAALVLTLLVAAAFLPAQALHMANHKLALGQPAALVWALMVFDALWVGLFTALVGSALFVGCRTGLTWRGWTIRPGDLG